MELGVDKGWWTEEIGGHTACQVGQMQMQYNRMPEIRVENAKTTIFGGCKNFVYNFKSVPTSMFPKVAFDVAQFWASRVDYNESRDAWEIRHTLF